MRATKSRAAGLAPDDVGGALRRDDDEDETESAAAIGGWRRRFGRAEDGRVGGETLVKTGDGVTTVDVADNGEASFSGGICIRTLGN